MITPVWRDGRPIFFVASRGHHADIGGISPGSMPPFSRKLIDEGACIKSFKLVENGMFNEDGITELLLEPGMLPRGPGEASMSGARLLSDNLSDLKAQIAANQRGIDLLLEMVDHYSLDVVQAYMPRKPCATCSRICPNVKDFRRWIRSRRRITSTMVAPSC